MATRYNAMIFSNNTDALFRLWINEFHNAITGFGWVQTGDTGQINFSTATHPTTTSTYPGYALYRMNDSFQSTTPVYIRVDFGSTPNLADRPGIKIQLVIGTTDGAGNLTGGALSSQIQTNANASYNSTTVGMRSSGDAGSFRFHAALNDTASAGFCVIIERDKDAAGNDTAQGVNLLVYHNPGSASPSSQYMDKSGALGSLDTKWWSLVHASSNNGGGAGVVRTQMGRFRNPLKGVVVVTQTDFTSGVAVSLPMYGVNHNYMMLSPQAGTGTAINGLNTACKFGILWE